MTTIKNFAAVMMVACGLVGLANAQNQRHVSKPFGFSVTMPDGINTQEQTLKTPIGNGKQFMMTYADSDRMFLAAAIELPPLFETVKDDPAVINGLYEGFTKGFAQAIKGEVTRTKFDEGNLKGEEFVVEGLGAKFVGRIFFTNGKVYALVTTAPAEANDFYKSFQVEAN